MKAKTLYFNEVKFVIRYMVVLAHITSYVMSIQIKAFYHINCGVIQGFPAPRKAVTIQVKKYRIFSRLLI